MSDALTRIAEALERLAPAPMPAPDFGAADAFLWHSGPDRLDPVQDVARVDHSVGELVEGIENAGLAGRVNYVVVSDHGMTPTAPSRLVVLDDYIDLADADIVDWAPVTAIQPKPGAAERVYARLKDAHPQMAVYRRGEVPARYHFNDNARITEIVAVAADGWTITSRAQVERWRETGWSGGGNHGFDPELVNMGALFVAAGPGIAEGRVLPPFRNVHVYSLMAHLLRLDPAPTDGRLDSLRAALR